MKEEETFRNSKSEHPGIIIRAHVCYTGAAKGHGYLVSNANHLFVERYKPLLGHLVGVVDDDRPKAGEASPGDVKHEPSEIRLVTDGPSSRECPPRQVSWGEYKRRGIVDILVDGEGVIRAHLHSLSISPPPRVIPTTDPLQCLLPTLLLRLPPKTGTNSSVTPRPLASSSQTLFPRSTIILDRLPQGTYAYSPIPPSRYSTCLTPFFFGAPSQDNPRLVRTASRSADPRDFDILARFWRVLLGPALNPSSGPRVGSFFFYLRVVYLGRQWAAWSVREICLFLP